MNGKEAEQQITQNLAALKLQYEKLSRQQAALFEQEHDIRQAMAPLRQQLGELQRKLSAVNLEQSQLNQQLQGINASMRRTEQLRNRFEVTTQLTYSLTEQAKRMQHAEDSLVQAFGNVVMRALTNQDVLQRLPDLVEDGLIGFISDPNRNRLQVGQRPNSTRILLSSKGRHAIIYHPVPNPDHYTIIESILNAKAPEKNYQWAAWTIVVGINAEAKDAQIWPIVMGIQKPKQHYSRDPLKLVSIYTETIDPVLEGIGGILRNGTISLPK